MNTNQWRYSWSNSFQVVHTTHVLGFEIWRKQSKTDRGTRASYGVGNVTFKTLKKAKTYAKSIANAAGERWE